MHTILPFTSTSSIHVSHCLIIVWDHISLHTNHIFITLSLVAASKYMFPPASHFSPFKHFQQVSTVHSLDTHFLLFLFASPPCIERFPPCSILSPSFQLPFSQPHSLPSKLTFPFQILPYHSQFYSPSHQLSISFSSFFFSSSATFTLSASFFSLTYSPRRRLGRAARQALCRVPRLRSP